MPRSAPRRRASRSSPSPRRRPALRGGSCAASSACTRLRVPITRLSRICRFTSQRSTAVPPARRPGGPPRRHLPRSPRAAALPRIPHGDRTPGGRLVPACRLSTRKLVSSGSEVLQQAAADEPGCSGHCDIHPVGLLARALPVCSISRIYASTSVLRSMPSSDMYEWSRRPAARHGRSCRPKHQRMFV